MQINQIVGEFNRQNQKKSLTEEWYKETWLKENRQKFSEIIKGQKNGKSHQHS